MIDKKRLIKVSIMVHVVKCVYNQGRPCQVLGTCLFTSAALQHARAYPPRIFCLLLTLSHHQLSYPLSRSSFSQLLHTYKTKTRRFTLLFFTLYHINCEIVQVVVIIALGYYCRVINLPSKSSLYLAFESMAKRKSVSIQISIKYY